MNEHIIVPLINIGIWVESGDKGMHCALWVRTFQREALHSQRLRSYNCVTGVLDTFHYL